MAASTISKTSGAPLQGTDLLRVVRSTTSYKGTLADVATYVAGAMGALAVTAGSIEIGGTDATLTRVGAGRLAVEGSNVLMASDIGVTVQAYDADLAAWALVNPSSYSTTAQIAAAYQPLDADLTSWAGVTRASGFDTFAATPSSANLLALVTNETGTGALVFGTSPSLTSPTIAGGALSGTFTGAPTFSGGPTFDATTSYPVFKGTVGAIFTAFNTTHTAWSMFLAGTESGANAGANFKIANYSDAGAYIGDAMTITRSTGAVSFSGSSLTLAGVAVPTISSTDTLSNKTIASPTLSGTVAGSPTISGNWTFSDAAQIFGSGTDAVSLTGVSGPRIKVTGATAAITVRRDGYAELGFVSGGVSGVGTFSNHDLNIYANNSAVASFYSGGGMTIGSPTGGNKGAGTLNATAVYDDNTLLTDLVLDLAVAGTFDAQKYAAHPIAKEVAPWWFDPDQYAEFWKANRHLPGMAQWTDEANKPSTGALATRLTAVVETHAVLLANDNDRIKALEARVHELEAQLAA